MTKVDIEKAAAEYASEACRPLWRTGNEQVAMVDFIEGAKWRINSVWHDDLKKGQTNRCILVRFRNGLFMLFEDIRELKGIEVEVKMFAYIDDLVLDTED